VHTADEVFTTGTMGELSPVLQVDGRTIGTGSIGVVTSRLQTWHAVAVRAEGVSLPDW
jgi:branched-subunit amino acid aminotransferase/4-amino-4-deoxychorismate lyase